MLRSGAGVLGTLLLCASLAAPAQEPVDPLKVKVLLIGNSKYRNLPECPTSSNNIAILESAFRRLGFAVSKSLDSDIAQLSAAVGEFSAGVKPGEIAIVYYSGYGGQKSDDNYLIPVDFPATQGSLDAGAYSLRRIEADLEKAGTRLFILEASRQTDALANTFTQEGLTLPSSSPNTLIALPSLQGTFAPPAGNRATDIFTQTIADKLKEPGLTAEELFANVRDAVKAATRDAQVPVTASGVSKFYLTGAPTKKTGEVLGNPRDKQQYVWISGGSFQMGCVPGDGQCAPDEKPRHPVTIGKGFWMGQTEVTVETYQVYVNKNKKAVRMPSPPQVNPGWRNQNHPMVEVSWEAAEAFCRASGGRLPTEAEWEYAARAGVDGMRYSWGEKLSREKANFGGTGGSDIWQDSSPVTKFDANDWKLYDMSGNAAEWCSDWYDAGYYATSPDTDPPGPASGKEHVKRGGSFNSAEKELRLSFRGHYSKADNNTGFRCVLPSMPK